MSSDRQSRSGGTRAYLWFSTWYHWVLWVLVFGVVGLGMVGYADYYAHAGLETLKGYDPTILDLFYRGILLPQFKAGELIPGAVPWEINVARFLGPLLLATAALGFVARIMSTRVNHFRAGLARDHIIICGLSTKGRLTARNLSDEGRKVVVVESDHTNRAIRDLRARGVAVVIGDATDGKVLRRAGVAKARFVLAVCDEDAVNASVAAAVKAAREKSGRMVTCLAHIRDLRLCRVLREKEIWESATSSYSLEFFNTHESGALMMLNQSPPRLMTTRTGRPHFLLVGTGAYARTVVAQIIHLSRLEATGATDPGMKVTVVGNGADQFVARLADHDVRIPPGYELEPIEGELGFRRLAELNAPAKDDGTATLDGIYVCHDDDQENVTDALVAAAGTREYGTAVTVAIKDSAFLPLFLVGEVEETKVQDNLTVIDLLESWCDLDILYGGLHERLAREINDDYDKRHRATPGPGDDSPQTSLERWRRLDERRKESNRDAAADIGRKLGEVDCILVPLVDWDDEVFEFTPEEIEKLAELEHDRWTAHMRAQGWNQGEVLDDKAHTHPLMIAWDVLPETEKDKDREQVRLIPVLLAKVGYRPYRRPSASDRPAADSASASA